MLGKDYLEGPNVEMLLRDLITDLEEISRKDTKAQVTKPSGA
jgi:hypothetical protein